MLQEISRIPIQMSKHEEIYLTWHNSVLSVRTEKGVQLYELTRNLQSFDKGIDYVLTLVATSKCSPLTELVPKKLFKKDAIRNIEFVEMLVDQSLWPHNQSLVQEMANVADFKWSPRGMLHNNDCALAVLNNVGNIDIFGPGRHAWAKLLDLSQVIKEHCLSTNTIEKPMSVNDLKRMADLVETSAFSWGPMLENHACVLMTAQRNGKLLFWRLQYQEVGMATSCLGEVQTDCGEIITAVWVQKSEKDFVIVCANSLGQIFALDCCLQDTIVSRNTACLWSHKDRMVSKYICHKIVNNNIILVCSKYRHLVGLYIDKKFNILSQSINNINDHRITDLQKNQDTMYLSVVNGKLYRVDTTVTGKDLNLVVTLIETKDSYSSYELNSAACSSNGIIFALGMTNRDIKHRKASSNVDIVFAVDLEHTSEVDLLLKNPTKSLTDYWDCIVLLKYSMLKLKTVPPVNVKELYEAGNTDIYKLKIYHIILSFYDVLARSGKYIPRDLLPESSLEVVRDRLQVIHVRQILGDLYDTFKNTGKMLENVDLDTYIGAKKYLEYYCQKYKKDVSEFVTAKALSLCDTTNHKYICQCCDEEVQGFTCKNDHFNMFCSLTFTPIESYDYLVCKGCSCVARVELCDKNPMCIFCDLYFNNTHLPKLNCTKSYMCLFFIQALKPVAKFLAIF